MLRCVPAVVVLSAVLSAAVALDSTQRIVKKGPCYPRLGCFHLTEDYKLRTHNVFPDNPETINTRFDLYTPKNPEELDRISTWRNDTILKSNFDAKLPTKINIHGFLDSKLYGTWERTMKDQILLNGPYNVILVDWSGGNSFPYVQSVANIRVVAAEISLILRYLQELKGLKLEDVHLIGHSLGAHCAGYVGKMLPGLDRITGLDPAGPYFEYMPTTIRLDRGDAKFVDVIHTDGDPLLVLGLGMRQAIGHLDFYPNSGRQQPGCALTTIMNVFIDGVVKGIRSFLVCNHQRAIELWIISINHHRCEFVSHECESWSEFREGRCEGCGTDGSKCAVMGWRAREYLPHVKPTDSKKMYLRTGSREPYCGFSFTIFVKLDENLITRSEKGKVELTIKTANHSSVISLNDQRYVNLKPGSLTRYTVKSHFPLYSIRSLSLKWISSPFYIFLRNPTIAVRYFRVEHNYPINRGDNTTIIKESGYFCKSKAVKVPQNQKVVFPYKNMCS